MTRPSSRPNAAGRTGLAWWTLAGLGLFPVGWVASALAIATIERFVLEPVGLRAEAGELSLSIRNGIHQIAWGALVAAAAVPFGRGLVAGIRFRPSAAALLAVGLVIAATTQLLVFEFDRLRSGYVDADHVGMIIFAPPAIVAVALATWAAMAIPSPDRAVLIALAAIGAIGFALATIPSLPGLSDGIDPASVPLAVSLLVGAAFVVIAPVVARR